MTARGKEAAALALHRFGFGPAGDWIAAIAADPQGALLADLERPQAGLLAANLPSSGESAREVFDFRAEQTAKQKLALRVQKQAEAENAASLVDCRKPSGEPCMAPLANDAANQQPPLADSETRSAASAAAAATAFSGRSQGALRRRAGRRYRLRRAAGLVLVEPFLHLGGQDRGDGRPVRAGSDPAPRARPLCRFAAGGRKPSRHAVLFGQRPVHGRQFDRRHQPRQGAE